MEMSAHPGKKRSGRKSRAIRYHRVDLGDEDGFLPEEDDESALDRELGKSGHSKGKCCRVSKCCRNCSILLTVVLVVVGIIFIVAYSVSTVPTEEEIEKKFWDIWGGIQHHLHITEEGNTTMSDNVTQVATTAASLAVTAATVAAASHMRLDKPERVAENSLENLWQMERQLSNRHLPQYPQVLPRHSKRYSIKPAEPLWTETGFEMPQNRISIEPIFAERSGESSWERALAEVNENSKPSVNEETGLKEQEVAESKKQHDSGISHESTGPTPATTSETDFSATAANAMVSVSHDEKAKSDMGSSSTNAAAPSPTTKRASTRDDEVEATTVGVPTVKVWRDKLKKQYEENFQTFLVVSTTLIILVSLLFCCCIWRRIRARKAAKKRHFTRLVNDLNASERFTLVAPSDDESD